MTELDLIIDLHRGTSRQGPGSESATLKALRFINHSTTDKLQIADLGCGAGGQTLTLARHTNGEIIAVDLFPDFLEALDKKAEDLGLQQQINTLEASIEDLPFGNESLDIIWAEGAIYNIGFEKGIKDWKKYLKIGGYIAVSEITWITNQRPEAISSYWENAYPEIDVASKKISMLEDNGYSLVGYFYLDKKDWLDNYYDELRSKFPAFLSQHNHDELAQKVVRETEEEIKLYEAYQEYYSYGFYIARRDA